MKLLYNINDSEVMLYFGINVKLNKLTSMNQLYNIDETQAYIQFMNDEMVENNLDDLIG